MTTQRERRTITLSTASNKVLDKLGNHSAYLDGLILQHAREWTEALALLRGKGWVDAEIVATSEALVGLSLSAWARGGEFLARELERSQERTQVFTAHEVVAARRAKLFRQLRDDASIAWALATVAREYHLPNEDLQHALGVAAD